MKSPLRELEIERELSHELRDDLLFSGRPIFIKFDYRKCHFATIRGYAILRGAQVQGVRGGGAPPVIVSRTLINGGVGGGVGEHFMEYQPGP